MTYERASRDGATGRRMSGVSASKMGGLPVASVAPGDFAQTAALIDALEDAACLFDAGERFLACNLAFRKLNASVAGLLRPAMPLRRLIAALFEADRLQPDADAPPSRLPRVPGAPAVDGAFRQTDGEGRSYRVTLRRMDSGDLLMLAREIDAWSPDRVARLAAERKYRDIFDNATEGIYRSSLDGRMLTANHALVCLNGYDNEEELLAAVNDIGREWYVDPGRRAEFAEIMDRDGVVTGFESEIYRHRTRERIWISEDARLLRDDDGQPVCYEGSVREITAQKLAEAELRASEARFRQAFERGLLGLCIVDVDGIYQQVNEAYCEFFGYSPEELLGHDASVVLHPDMLDDVRQSLQQIVAGKEGGGLFPRRYRHKDGRDIWCRVGLSRLDLPGDRGPHVMVQVQDVTDIRQAEAARQSSERRFQDLVEGSIQGLFIHRDWELLFANQALAKMLGYDDAAEVVALGGIDPFYGQDDHRRLHGYTEARNRGEEVPTRYELQAVRRDGSTLWVEQLVTVVEWGGEQAIQVTVIDIDERKQAELGLRAAMEESERASRSKSEFLANMSHELRTPLNAILGFSEVIVDQLFGDVGNARYLDYARDINESGQHLLQVINDILDLSRVEAGKLELELCPVDIAEAVDACFRLLRGRASEASVALHSRIDWAPAIVLADPVKLKQILINLLTNAIKFTPDGGRVELLVAGHGQGGLEFIVQDTGIGMDEQDIEIALSPFGQVESVLARRHHGTGLGLPLVQSLVDLHGGKLSIASSRGAGTTVTVSWPAALVRADDADA